MSIAPLHCFPDALMNEADVAYVASKSVKISKRGQASFMAAAIQASDVKALMI